MPAEKLHSSPTLCNPLDPSLPDSPSVGLSRPEYWSGLLYPLLGDLLNPGIEPESLESPALADELFTSSATLECPPPTVQYALPTRRVQ